MFQMINEESTQPRDHKMAVVGVGAFTVALLALVGAVYFFAFFPYFNR